MWGGYTLLLGLHFSSKKTGNISVVFEDIEKFSLFPNRSETMEPYIGLLFTDTHTSLYPGHCIHYVFWDTTLFFISHCYFITLSKAAYYASITVGFNFIQIVGLFGDFDLEWPDEVRRGEYVRASLRFEKDR